MRNKLTGLLLAGVMSCSLAASVSAVSYPQDVQYPVEEGGLIAKTYVVSSMDEIESLDRMDIEYQGVTYRYQDMTVKELGESDSKNFIQTLTGESDTKDEAKIIATLDLQKEVTTEDGYVGLLDLDTSSLNVEVTEYGSSSKTKTTTRTYTGLSDADLTFIPKTVTENGVTCSLVDVSWKEESPYNPYDEEYGNRFNAYATYTGKYSAKYAKGYSYAVKYYGTVTKDSIEGYECVLMFAPQENDHFYDVFVGDSANPIAVFFGIALLILLLLCAGFTVYTLLNRNKGQTVTTTTEEYVEPSSGKSK